MLKNDHGSFILKKAYEISYAIFRISPYIGNPGLKERLEIQALSLIDFAAMQNYTQTSLTARSIEYLIRFGGDTAIINLMNAETIIVQIGALNVAIAESGNAATPKEVPLEGIFSDKSKEVPEVRNEDAETYYHPAIKPIPVTIEETAEVGTEEHATGGVFKAAIRQSAILERIRQSGNCRLKDILEILPDLSERTIRYDLQSLMEQNLIERIGNGGPSVYYRVREDSVR